MLINFGGLFFSLAPLRDAVHAETRANARLIAAAPELLAALKAAVSDIVALKSILRDLGAGGTMGNAAIKQGRAAIAKAKGRAS